MRVKSHWPRNTVAPSSESTKAERKSKLRKSAQRLANRLARMLGVETRQVHREWITLSGPAHGQATEEDLQRKKEWLIRRIKETQLGERSTAAQQGRGYSDAGGL